MSDELFAVDEERADQEVRAIAARILSGQEPASEIRRILRTTRSVAYTRMIAERAAKLIVEYTLSDEMVVTMVGVPAGRLAQFIRKVRMEFALFEPRD